jgi:hypothetical protein
MHRQWAISSLINEYIFTIVTHLSESFVLFCFCNLWTEMLLPYNIRCYLFSLLFCLMLQHRSYTTVMLVVSPLFHSGT